MKRFLAFLLSTALCLGLFPASAFAAGAPGTGEQDHPSQFENVELSAFESSVFAVDDLVYGEGDGLTRGEWLHDLALIFGLSVDESTIPDNYYADLTSDHAYYQDIMACVNFGAVQVVPGGNILPDDPADRDFAAFTMQKCMNFVLDDESAVSISDAADCTDLTSAKVAVSRGWFALVGGAFKPSQAVTDSEASAIFADVAAILEQEQISSEDTNEYQFADDVIVFPQGTDVSFTDSTVTINGSDQVLTSGDTFVVYYDDMALLYKAASVQTSDGTMTVVTEEADEEASVISVKESGSIDIDLSTFDAADDVKGTYIATQTQAAEATKLYGIKIKKGSVVASKTITLTDGLKANLVCNLTSLKFNHKNDVLSGDYYDTVSGNYTLTANVSADVVKLSGFPATVTIGRVDICPGVWIDVTVNVEFSANLSATVTGEFETGFSKHSGDSFRIVGYFMKKNFSTAAEANAAAAVKVAGHVDVIAAKGSIYAQAGIQAYYKSNTYNDGNAPNNCTTISAWLFMDVGANATLGIGRLSKSFSEERIIYDRNNSPALIWIHYEDGTRVDSCSRGEQHYYTPWDSRYGSGYDRYGRSSGLGRNGEPYTIYTYTLDDLDQATITSYKGNVSTLVIPEKLDGYTVVGIAEGVFVGNTGLYSVTIPDTITTIGAGAFRECTNIAYVKLSENLTYLGASAFRNCHALTSIHIPANISNTVTKVNLTNGAFAYCENLSDITFADGITFIAPYLFSNCTGLRSIEFPDTITEIGEYAFQNCENLGNVHFSSALSLIGNRAFADDTSLRSISIPDSVTEIRPGAFQACTNLSDVTLSKNLTLLGAAAFMNNHALTSIHIPAGIVKSASATNYTNGAFAYCENLKDITFEEGTTYIADYLFANTTGLEKITIPDTVTEIGLRSFDACKKLNDVKLSNSLNIIGNMAFSNCVDLTKIVIPDTVTEVKPGAFDSCVKLSDVTLSKNLTHLGASAFKNNHSLASIHIPAHITKSAATVNYTNGAFAFCENLKSVTFEEGITYIAEYLFANTTGLEEITIPDTVTELGLRSFDACENLTDVKFSKSLNIIGLNAFSGCSSLTKIVIPDTVTEIRAGAFENCVKLNDVTLSKGLLVLGASSFGHNHSLTSIHIPAHITQSAARVNYTSGAFAYCENLKNVTFEKGIKTIAANFFQNCTGLEEITIPETVESIQTDAFRDCTALKTFTLPDTVTSIGTGLFWGCNALTSITWNQISVIPGYTFVDCTALPSFTMTDSVTDVNERAFSGCSSLKSVVFSSNLKSINLNAFLNCTALESADLSATKLFVIHDYSFRNNTSLAEVKLPETLTQVYQYAFANCDSLTAITIPDAVTYIGAYTFYDCDKLADVKLGTGITSIINSTFRQCDSLESIVIPYRVTTIEANAFLEDIKLTSVYIPRSVTSINTTAFSYPDRMKIYGVAGTYAETFANDNGFEFVSKEVAVTSVTAKPASLTLFKGKTASISVKIEPYDFTDTVTWKSSDTSIATITEAGLVKAVAPGTCTIKVVAGKKSASIAVTVLQPVTSIYLNKSSITINGGDTYQLTATVNPAAADDKTVTWSSSDESVASVDQNGLVTGKTKGTSVITCTANDGSGITGKCTVTVKSSAIIADSVDQLESLHDYEDNSEEIWIYRLPGAEKLIVTFDDRTNIEDGFDFLYIYDANDNEIKKSTGTELAGAVIEVPGDTLKLKLVSDDSGTEWGFKISKVTKPVSSDFTGLSDDGFYYVNGQVETTYNGFASDEAGDWYYIAGGRISAETTALVKGTVKKKNTYWKVVEGKVSFTDGLASNANGTYYVKAGAVDFTYNGYAADDKGDYFIVKKGKVTAGPVSYVKSLTALANGIKLSWVPVSGADSYRIFYKTEGGKWTRITNVSGTASEYTWTGAASGTTYYFAVRGLAADGTTYVSVLDSNNHSLAYVKAPVVTKAESAVTGIKITWGTVAGAEKYRIFYKVGSGKWTKVADVAAGSDTASSQSYTWTGAVSGTTYTFVVRALNAAGNAYTSALNSNGKSIAYVAAPAVTKAENATNGVKVTWGTVKGAEKYRIFYKVDGGKWTKITDVTASTAASQSYTWTGAASGKTYTFVVRAVNAAGTTYTSALNTAGKTILYVKAPTVSSAINTSSGIKVTWGAVTGAEKYRLFYKVDGGKWTKVTDTASTSYTWSGAVSGKTYTFVVRAINVAGTAYTSALNTNGVTITAQ